MTVILRKIICIFVHENGIVKLGEYSLLILLVGI